MKFFSQFKSIEMLRERLKNGTFYEILEDWKWILGYSKKYKGAILFYIVLGIFSSSMGMVSSVAGKYLIDIVTGFRVEKLGVLIAVTVGSGVFSLTFTSITNRISTKLSIYINNDIQADIFEKIMDADWMAINQYANGDVLNRFNSDVSTVSGNAIEWLPSIILAIYNFMMTFFVILHYDVVMALLAFGTAPVTFFMSRMLIKKQREYGKKVREMSSNLMTFEVETFYNMDTIKSFGVTSHYEKKMRNWQEKFKNTSLEYNLFSIKTNAMMSVLGMIVQYIAFGYCLFRLWTHDITYGTMTLFLQQRSNLSTNFDRLVSIIPSFLNSSISAHRIRELVELPREVHRGNHNIKQEDIAQGLCIEMEHVNFSYEKGKEVITASNFQADPGEIIALVGPSGEGKTTMIRLLLGLIYPESGMVKMRLKDQTSMEMNADMRYLFSYVPQGNTILSGTIAENMRIVKEDATEEEIIEALKMACAWNFIKDLPQGIHSNIGERGRGFSEGQAQRIAIARAILRDAPILLMDEATSALDVATERQVLRNIMVQQPNKTCIVTTHRPSVLNLCKRVYRVLDTKVTELTEEESSKMAMEF